MSNLCCLSITLTQSNLEKKLIACVFGVTSMAVLFSPISWFAKTLLLIGLLFYLYIHLRKKDSQLPLRILSREDKWLILNGAKEKSYQSATLICQLGWLLVIRFDCSGNSYLLPIYKDQIAEEDYHYLCLLIRII